MSKIRTDLRKTEEDLDGQVLAVVKLTDDLNQAIALANPRRKRTRRP